MMAKMLNFSDALRALKDGKKLQRINWNGPGQFVCLMPSLSLPAEKVNERTRKFVGEDTDLESQAYFALKTTKGHWQPGWVPSQSDLLATDWIIID